MNKGQLVDKVAEEADIGKAATGRPLDSLMEAVTSELASDGDVALVGFGTFKGMIRVIYATWIKEGGEDEINRLAVAFGQD